MKKMLKRLTIVGSFLLISAYALSCAPAPWDMAHGGFFFGWSPLFGFPFGLIGLGVYFLPTIFAAVRRSKSMLGIVLVNVLAGWTFIGWVIALVWSLTGASQKA